MTTATQTSIPTGSWVTDRVHSTIGFSVKHLGIATVRGKFDEFEGRLEIGEDLSSARISGLAKAASIDTGEPQRDAHLRSPDFFDVEHHGQVRFVSDSATLDGDVMKVRGHLHAAGKDIPLELDATVRRVDGQLELDAVTEADHRQLGMTWSPLGILRAPSKLIVRGRLVRQGGQR